MMFGTGSQSKTLRHVCHLPFLVSSSSPSKELDMWVVGHPKILQSSTGSKDASRWCRLSYHCILSFSQQSNLLSLHSLTLPVVTPVIFSCLSPATFLNHDTLAPHFPSSFSSFQQQENQMIYPRWGSWWWSQHDTERFQQSLQWQFSIRQRPSAATIEATNGQAAMKRFFHVNTWKTGCGNSIHSYVRRTPRSWASGGLYCLGGGGWIQACTAGIQEAIRLSTWMFESTRSCIYSLEEGFNRNQWASSFMGSRKSVAIWALCWRRDRPQRRFRMKRPDNPCRRSGHGHGECEAYSYQLCNVGESLATNAVKTAQMHGWWYEDIARIDPAQRNSDPAHADISVVNESSQRLFSLLTLCMRPSQWLLTPMQQW